MGFKSDIEIAQECTMEPITKIAEKAGIDDKYLEQYGKYKAKIDYNLLKETDKKDGKLILVTAINPTPAGEGKTTTTVGLADGMQRLGKNVMVALREPSLGHAGETARCCSSSSPVRQRSACGCWSFCRGWSFPFSRRASASM